MCVGVCQHVCVGVFVYKCVFVRACALYIIYSMAGTIH